MKFGKRFTQAQGEYQGDYLCYKAVKQALKYDCLSRDALGSKFEQVLGDEMDKVSKFYMLEESQLTTSFRKVKTLSGDGAAEALQDLHRHIQDLTKFAALNYVAVLKAIKKRNRRLRDACGDVVVTVAPFSILQHQAFFSSKQLTELSAETAKLDSDVEARTSNAKARKAYSCPICRHLLQAPVRLTCTHAFCWGCITMYCLGVLQTKSDTRPEAIASPAPMSQLQQGWAPVTESDGGVHQFACPVCKQQQRLELDNLTVDKTLAHYVDKHSMRHERVAAHEHQPPSMAVSVASTADLSVASNMDMNSSDIATSPASTPKHTVASESSEDESSGTAAAMPSALPLRPAVKQENSESTSAAPRTALLPPQQPQWRGKLSIVLDIDGTLVASFPPRRAPRLPDGMRTHLVGAGSSLNPHGVFVVERPGLQEFLEQISKLGELSVFTAGLPEYAMPILHAIDPSGRYFGDRVVCRGGTSAAPEYPCVKDLSRLGRDMARTVIIDDTPLAFLWQATNGVPVLGFRGVSDDNLLLCAVLPLLQLAADEADVRPFLNDRFGMAKWFTAQGYVTHATAAPGQQTSAAHSNAAGAPAVASADAVAAVERALEQRHCPGETRGGPLLLCDFDKTLVDFDVTERVTEEVAIELKPFLQDFAAPADFVPVMNAVLREMRTRGVPLDKVTAALRNLGGEMSPDVAAALCALQERGISRRVLSNCNVWFINEVLAGAGLESAFTDVLTHSADVRSNAPSSDAASAGSPAAGAPPAGPGNEWAVHISPCQTGSAKHECSLCPPTLCKGMWVNALAAHHPRIVFCGDGANDLCPVLCLRAGDVALIRRDFACHKLVEERRELGDGAQQTRCKLLTWSTQAELASLICSEFDC